MHSSLILHGMGQNERIATATTTTAIVIILLDLQRCFDCVMASVLDFQLKVSGL